MARTDWDTPSGFADDFDFVIDEPRFGFLSNYMSGEVPMLIWGGHSPDDDGVTEIAFPIGTGWEVKANGQRVEHESGKKKFVRNSIIGHLIRRVVDELKVESVLDSSPTEAKVWKGLAFHMKREKIAYPGLKKDDKDGKEGVETERLMPVAVIESGKTRSGTASGASKAESKAAGSESSSSSSASSGDSPTIKALRTLALKLDRAEFQMKALDMKAVTDDDTLMSRVLDDGDEGFWAQARAEAEAKAS